jgi:hypothetical protein
MSALVALAASVALAGPSSANTPLKGYAVVVAPTTINGGTTTSMTATFTNEALLPRLAAAELFWPAPLQVLSATVSTPFGPVSVLTTCRRGTRTGPCIRLPGLALWPRLPLTVNLSVKAPPNCTTVIGAWAFVDPSNLPLDSAHSKLTTTVVDSCHLQFVTQPHGAIVNQNITGTDYDTSGPPVTVEVLDANAALVTSSTASVSVAFGNNPSAATLGGTTTQPTAGGIASFADLAVDQAGNNYTLTASSAGITSTTSSAFAVQAKGTPCTAGSCTLSASAPGGSGQVVGSPSNTASSGTLVESVNASGNGPVTCSGYTTSDPNTYEFLTTSPNFTKTVTITITNPIGAPPIDLSDTDGFTIPGGDGDHDYDDVLWNSQLCYQAPAPFTTAPGTPLTQSVLPDGSTAYTGLLPDCPAAGPCHDRSHDQIVGDENAVGYDIVLVGSIPAGISGDPRMN